MPIVLNSDDWVAWDKLEHFVGCAAVTAAVNLLFQRSAYRIALALAAGLLVGVLKELGDYLHWWPGAVSYKDLTADVAGTLLAAAVILWWEQRHAKWEEESALVDIELGTTVGGFALTIRQHPQAGLQPLQRQRGPGASEGGPSLTLVEHDTQPLAGPAPRPSPAVGPAEPTVPPQPATRAAEVSSHAAAGPSSSGGGTERTGQQPGKALPAPGPADPGGTGGGGTTSPGLSRSGTSAAAGQEAAGPSPPASARAQGADAAVVQQTGPSPEDHLGNVGLVTWQCGFLLAELLLRRPPLGAWTDVRVLDLGCGCGLVGIALAVAGAASVTLTDLPHVLPLARENVALNCERFGIAQQQRPRVLPHAWGDAESAAALLPQPDLITAADVLYDPTYHGALLSSLELLCAPHTLVYVAWKKRHKDEESFLALAETRGFAVEQVPQDQLAEEYREGPYAVLRLCRLEPMELD